MNSLFTLYVDRIREEQSEEIDLVCPPDFLAIDEPELIFTAQVKVKGKAYLAQDHFIVELHAKAEALLPCKICNELSPFSITTEPLRLVLPISSIKGGVYRYEEDLREAILIEIPLFFECNGGKCPSREKMKPYLHTKEEETPPTYLPFSNL